MGSACVHPRNFTAARVKVLPAARVKVVPVDPSTAAGPTTPSAPGPGSSGTPCVDIVNTKPKTSGSDKSSALLPLGASPRAGRGKGEEGLQRKEGRSPLPESSLSDPDDIQAFSASLGPAAQKTPEAPGEADGDDLSAEAVPESGEPGSTFKTGKQLHQQQEDEKTMLTEGAGSSRAAGSASAAKEPAALPEQPQSKEAREAKILRQAALQQGSGSRPKRPRSLIKAIKDGDLGAVRDLLKGEGGCAGERPDLEARGMWENTPLLVACSYNQPDIALALLETSANPYAANEFGVAAPHYAAIENMRKVMEALLLRISSSSEGSDEAEKASVSIAAEKEKEEGSEKEEGEEQKGSATTTPKTTHTMITSVVNPPAAKLYNRHLDTYVLRTPLAAAAENGFLDMVQLLLKHEADVNAQKSDVEEAGVKEEQELGEGCGGKTPLWLACRRSHLEVAKELLGRKADVSLRSEDGTSPLEAACIECKSEVLLQALLEAGAEVNQTAGSPLRLAVQKGNHRAVELLLTNGADVCRQSGKAEQAPLHVACQKMDEHVVRLLLQRKADPGLKDKHGRSAFDVLARLASQGAQDVADLEALLRAGRRAAVQASVKEGSASVEGTGGTGEECAMDLD